MVKYNNLWGKIESFIGRRTLNCNPVFSNKYLKSKTRSYNNNVTTISDNADNNDNLIIMIIIIMIIIIIIITIIITYLRKDLIASAIVTDSVFKSGKNH